MSGVPSQFILIAVANQDSIERDEECTPPSHEQLQNSTSRTSGAPRRTDAGPSRLAIRLAVEASGDTSGMRARVTSSRFVGRARELAELERASRDAAEQRPVVVLLGGDSGVGKTRLMREFERRVSARTTSSCCAGRPWRKPTASFRTHP